MIVSQLYPIPNLTTQLLTDDEQKAEKNGGIF
jgi:hypothetical protein